MRSQEEIQRAHDALIAVLRDEVPVSLTDEQRAIINAQVDVLCWFLQDEHKFEFGRNLDALYVGLAKLGFMLEEAGGVTQSTALHSVRRQILGKLEARLGGEQTATDHPQPTNHFGHRSPNECDPPHGPSFDRVPGRDSESSVAISDVESSKLRVERPH